MKSSCYIAATGEMKCTKHDNHIVTGSTFSKMKLYNLFTTNSTYINLYINSAMNNFGNTDAIMQKLLALQIEIGSYIDFFAYNCTMQTKNPNVSAFCGLKYNDPAKYPLVILLKEFIFDISNLISAKKANNDNEIKESVNKINSTISQISTHIFLLKPKKIQAKSISNHMTQLSQNIINIINNHSNKNFHEEMKTCDKFHQNTNNFSNTLYNGLK